LLAAIAAAFQAVDGQGMVAGCREPEPLRNWLALL
jgi:hypothetical protein